MIAKNPLLGFTTTLDIIEDCTLSYVAHGEANWNAKLQQTIGDCLKELQAIEALDSVHFRVIFDPSWESPIYDASINMPQIRKVLPNIERSNVNAISRLVTFYVLDEGTRKIVLVPGLAVLSYVCKGDRESMGLDRPARGTISTPYRERPNLEPKSWSDPSHDDIDQIIQCFLRSESNLRTIAKAMAHRSKDEAAAWKASIGQRRRGVVHLGALIRAEKAIFGFGHGQEIISQAEIQPKMRAKLGKKNKITIDHDQAQHLFWMDAINLQGADVFGVPYIKM